MYIIAARNDKLYTNSETLALSAAAREKHETKTGITVIGFSEADYQALSSDIKRAAFF